MTVAGGLRLEAEVAQGRLQLEAGLRVVELVAQQLPEPPQSVPDGLRVDVEGAAHGGRVSGVLYVGEGGRPHPLASRLPEVLQRAQPAPDDRSRDRGALAQQQLPE